MTLPDKIKSSRIPLGIKLTIFFTLFGICIAYITFVMMSMKGTHDVVEHYRSAVTGYFNSHQELCEDLSSDIKFEEFIGKVPVLRDVSLLQQSLVQVNLYERGLSDEQWVQKASVLNNEADGAALRAARRKKSVGEPSLNSNLGGAAEKGFAKESSLFFGRSDLFSFYIRVQSGAEAESIQILQFVVSRAGISEVFSHPARDIVLFTLMVIAVSLLLSQVFVSKIVTPINWLANEANKAAEGNRAVRFSLKGKDSIAKLSRVLDRMMDENAAYIQRIRKQSDTLETMNHIDHAVLSSVSRRDLIDKVTDFTAELYPENGVLLILKDYSKTTYQLLTHRIQHKDGESGVKSEMLKEGLISPAVKAYLDDESLLPPQETPLPDEVLRHLPTSSVQLYNVPIYVEADFYGSLLVSSDFEEGFSAEDKDLMEKLGDQIGVALQSLLQVEEKENLLYGSLQALSASIDAKSRWTAGHSQRVREVADIIGRAAHMNEFELNQLSIAALLHDIGKLGIPETILDKPGRLTEEEYAVIKTHPGVGADIFGHIPDNPEVVQGILYHHEQWSGGGYPEGLQGEDIPMVARVLCVADVYDAISADRPYRKGMTRGEVVSFFKEKREIMFDPQLTDLFLELFESGRIS